MKQKQKTIQKNISLQGWGVHSGRPVTLSFSPAPSGSGIVWQHAQTGQKITIGVARSVPAPHATIVAQGQWRLSTVEHVMAALWACDIDNIVITIDSDEVPIADGSALTFYLLLQRAGTVEQEHQKVFIKPRQEIILEDKQRNGFIKIVPTDDTSLYGRVVYTDTQLTEKTQLLCVDRQDFAQRFVPARTCGFIEQLPYLRSLGLAQASTSGNTVILSQQGGTLNSVRFAHEPVHHKVLDLIGDLFLLGKKIAGVIEAQNTGHDFNRLLLEQYHAQPERWQTMLVR